MKKRLRKKLCLAEFTEWGVDLAVKRTGSEGFDEFFDEFIELVEAQDCYCGGGGHEDQMSVVIELGRSRELASDRVAIIKKWLDKRKDVKAHRFSNIFDLCNGDWKEFDAELAAAEAFLKG